MAEYVEISGISLEALDFLGYYVVDESDEFIVFTCKGDLHVVSKTGCVC